jgi:hypothetical protein
MMKDNFACNLFKIILCGILLAVTKPALAQTDIDGLMMEKNISVLVLQPVIAAGKIIGKAH